MVLTILRFRQLLEWFFLTSRWRQLAYFRCFKIWRILWISFWWFTWGLNELMCWKFGALRMICSVWVHLSVGKGHGFPWPLLLQSLVFQPWPLQFLLAAGVLLFFVEFLTLSIWRSYSFWRVANFASNAAFFAMDLTFVSAVLLTVEPVNRDCVWKRSREPALLAESSGQIKALEAVNTFWVLGCLSHKVISLSSCDANSKLHERF